MVRKRINNDLTFLWTITDLTPELLDRITAEVVLTDEIGDIQDVTVTREGNIFRIEFLGKDQHELGQYTLTLYVNRDAMGMAVVDMVDACELVPHSYMEGGETGQQNLTVNTISIESKLNAGATIIHVVDGLESNSPIMALSANQGRVLNGKINKIIGSIGKKEGIASLGPDGKVLSQQLPALLVLGETASTAYPGSKGKANAEAIANLQGTVITEIQLEGIPVKPTDNKVNLTGLATTKNLEQVSSDLDGKIPTSNSQLLNDEEFIKATVDNLVNYYKKSEVYTQEQVRNLVGSITTINFKKVDVLPAKGEANLIYLVPNGLPEKNIYDEVIFVDGVAETIGTTQADLSNYYTKEESEGLFVKKVDTGVFETVLHAEKTYATQTALTDGLKGKQPTGDYALKSDVDTEKARATGVEGNLQASIEDLQAFETRITEFEALIEHDREVNRGLVDNSGDHKSLTYDAEEGYRICGHPLVVLGHGAPSAETIPKQRGIPAFVGQTYIDLSVQSGGHYYAKGTGSISDWANS